jgi:GH25 family lysozyme M1 (1,4-beta-N-acetylmuramidase)
MRKHHVKVGCYHFMRPKAGRSGAVEAKFFVRQAKAMGWGKPGDLRLVLDFEATTLSPAKTVHYLEQAVDAITDATGKPPIIYTGGPFWDEHTGSSTLSYGCPLWLAAYVKEPNKYLPAAWQKWDLWQFTDEGSVEGIASENVDQNIARRLPLI